MDATLIRRLPAVLAGARSRLPTGISRGWLRGTLVANVAGQVLIVLSGGIVRLTGSGLGCPTFPECVRGSYVPVVTQPQGFHKYIEFGNRMLAFVLTALAVAAFVAVRQYVRGGGPGGRRLLAFGAVPFVGVLLQALIGGISVLTKLNPAVVALHFLTSMALIAASTVLLLVTLRAYDARTVDAVPAGPRPGPRVRLLSLALALATVPVLVLGTVVTGSGPHSGDAKETSRFHFSIPLVAHLHAGAVWVFVLLLLALVTVLRRTGGPVAARRRAAVLVGITVAQGVIGYVQYALGVPIALVAAHMLGASLLVATTTATVFAVLARALVPVRPGPEPGPAPGEAGKAGKAGEPERVVRVEDVVLDPRAQRPAPARS